MIREEIITKLSDVLKQVHDDLQKRPNQYVVGYFRQSDNSLVGYHASTFCQITQDILNGKRYAGENPYPQLEIIAKNIKYTLDTEKFEGMFAEVNKSIQEGFGGLKSKDIYLDAIYLAEGTPKQDFRYVIVDNTKEDESYKLN